MFLFLGSFAVFANLHLAYIVMPIYVLELGGSQAAAAWFNALMSGAAVVFRFMLVSWVDRLGRKFCLLLSGAALVIPPLLILLTGSLVLLALVRLVQGLGLALYPLTASALVADLSPEERRGTALGLMRVIIITALIAGPPVAGAIVGRYGFQSLFLVLGCAGLVGMTPLLAIREPVRPHSGMPAWSKIRTALSSRPLRILFFATTATGLAYGVLLTFLPLSAFRVGIENIGFFYTVFAFSGMLSGVATGRLSDSLGRKTVLLPALVLFGAGVMYLSVLTPGIGMSAAALVSGTGYAASLTLLVAWVVDEAGRKLRAASLSLFENGTDLGITLGSFGFGAIIALAGFGAVFSVTGLLLLLAAALVATINRGAAPAA